MEIPDPLSRLPRFGVSGTGEAALVPGNFSLNRNSYGWTTCLRAFCAGTADCLPLVLPPWNRGLFIIFD